MNSLLLSACLAAGLVLAAGASAAQTQPATSSLIVRIVDETGAAIPQAAVRVENVDSGHQRQGESTSGGQVTIPLLPAGTYTVLVERAGFAPARVDDVALRTDNETTIEVQLKVESLAEAVVVTAQKRGEERLQDVPIPVSVLDADRLASNGQVLLRDYYATVPGLALLPTFLGRQALVIRGITTGGETASTVGIMVDDVAINGYLVGAGSNSVPDIDPGDLARVEVLRGPQGTLFGANSMGGLLRFVTKDPSFDGRSARLELNTNSTHGSGEPGVHVRASGNLPVSDVVAIRASGFWRQDPGYIDNPVIGADDVNGARVYGGRMSALLRRSAAVSLKLSAQFQYSSWDGGPEVIEQPGMSGFQQNFMAGAGEGNNTLHTYAATLTYRLRHADLTSVTAYNINRGTLSLDWTDTFLQPFQSVFGDAGLIYRSPFNVKRFSQELRLTGRTARRFEWLGAAFFADQSIDRLQIGTAEDRMTGRYIAEFYRFAGPGGFEELAAFGGVTVRVTDRFDIQAGGRQSRYRAELSETSTTGPYTSVVLNQLSPVVSRGAVSSSNAFTYLLTPRFRASNDLMIYARLASGYRPGQPNTVFAPDIPIQPDADKTKNYEVGVKGSFLEGALTGDASIYYIDWSDIQVQARDPLSNFVYRTNGSGAKSEGVELSGAFTSNVGLTVSAWGTYDNAVLTDPIPPGPLYGLPGDRLPFTSRLAGSISLEQRMRVSDRLTGFGGLVVTHAGKRAGEITSSAVREIYPAYTKTDLRCGVESATWAATLFVNNLTDARGALQGGAGYFYPAARIYTTPRTVGIALSRTF